MTTTASQSLLLVGNPTSGAGRAAKAIDKVVALFNERGIPHEFRPTLPHGGTVEFVRRAIDDEGFATVVYMGGDGTFYEVAKAICLSRNPSAIMLGRLPAGTANDQGKSFGISSGEKALEENVRILENRHTTFLDVGRIRTFNDDGSTATEDFFFDSLGWGLSAAILAFRNQELQQVKNVPIWRDMYQGHAVYIRAAMHELALNWILRDRFTLEMTVDGEVHHFDRLSDLVISNTMLYAGEWIIDPQSKPDDGFFEIGLFSGVRDWTSKLIVHHKHNPLTVEMLEKIGLSHSPVLKGRSITLQFFRPNAQTPLPAQRDGEEFVPAEHVQVDAVPRLLQVIVPENFHWI
jgi:diacylglycerol kinase family enzyme